MKLNGLSLMRPLQVECVIHQGQPAIRKACFIIIALLFSMPMLLDCPMYLEYQQKILFYRLFQCFMSILGDPFTSAQWLEVK